MEDMYHPLRIKFKLKDLMEVPGASMVRTERPYFDNEGKLAFTSEKWQMGFGNNPAIRDRINEAYAIPHNASGIDFCRAPGPLDSESVLVVEIMDYYVYRAHAIEALLYHHPELPIAEIEGLDEFEWTDYSVGLKKRLEARLQHATGSDKPYSLVHFHLKSVEARALQLKEAIEDSFSTTYSLDKALWAATIQYEEKEGKKGPRESVYSDEEQYKLENGILIITNRWLDFARCIDEYIDSLKANKASDNQFCLYLEGSEGESITLNFILNTYYY